MNTICCDCEVHVDDPTRRADCHDCGSTCCRGCQVAVDTHAYCRWCATAVAAA